jgi:hypothetical protein
MKATNRLWRYLLMPLALGAVSSVSSAAELNPAAVTYKLPDQIPWGPVNARGAQSAVVVGDPSKPGFYMVYMVGRIGHEIRSRQHHGDARRQFCDAFRQAGALGRRQGRGHRAADHGRGTGDVDRRGGEVAPPSS